MCFFRGGRKLKQNLDVAKGVKIWEPVCMGNNRILGNIFITSLN
jgi:hypothetical protein